MCLALTLWHQIANLYFYHLLLAAKIIFKDKLNKETVQ